MLAGVRVSRLVGATFGALGLCLAYWFWSAPDVRFGSGYLAAAGILGLSVACAAYFHETDLFRRLALEAVAVSVLLGISALAQSGNTWTMENRSVFALRTAPGGKSIWVTVSDRGGSSHCWDHPLPCTPYFEPEKLKRIRWR
jgi:hypothetical protein